MAVLEPGKDDFGAIMACIGHVCVQWALLENNLLGILASIENMDLDEAAIVFAGLDMRQRLCKAIALADHRKIDSGLRSRLRNMRSKIDRDKIVDRRNRAVHGVHRASEKPQHMVLSMPRLSGNARDAELSVKDFYDLSFEIRDLGIEAWSIFNDYGTWMFGEHRSEHDPRQLETARSGVWLKIKQYLGTRIKHLRG